jgi:hypothetical protein
MNLQRTFPPTFCETYNLYLTGSTLYHFDEACLF